MPLSLRRLRTTDSTRALFQETTLEPKHLQQPYFVVPERGVHREVKEGTGLIQVSPDRIGEEVRALQKLGLSSVMLFGVPTEKRNDATMLATQLEPLLQAVQNVKAAAPGMLVFADVCMCSYTPHGHCGVVLEDRVDNDQSVFVLSDMAVKLAKGGVDFVCPSDMMDGRVGAIRHALDAEGLDRTGIVSYAVKMASAFYGPFRDAADSAPKFGDRRSYQMQPHNRREALRELALDEAEGADVLLVKPALTNLDLIRDARERSSLPIFAYQVSGEYAMLKAAAAAGMLDFDRAITETLVSIRRAGADVIISYHARPWLMSV
jgi:porphobilinogen synthase